MTQATRSSRASVRGVTPADRSTSSAWPRSWCSVHPRTLRIYEGEGLVCPARTRQQHPSLLRERRPPDPVDPAPDPEPGREPRRGPRPLRARGAPRDAHPRDGSTTNRVAGAERGRAAESTEAQPDRLPEDDRPTASGRTESGPDVTRKPGGPDGHTKDQVNEDSHSARPTPGRTCACCRSSRCARPSSSRR